MKAIISGRLRKAAYSKCKICGSSFIHRLELHPRFCSKSCARKYLNLAYNCKNCGKEKHFKRSQLKKYPGRGTFCSMTCFHEYRRKNPSSKIFEHSNGYLMTGHKVYEHRLMMQKHLNRNLNKNEIIHHIDLDKKNNILSNFWIFYSQRDHNKAHWGLNRLVKDLIEKRIIKFSNGEYFLNED